jgi:hypothetical protein
MQKIEMIYTQMTNCNQKRVAGGIMAAVDAIQEMTGGEKAAVIAGMFYFLFKHHLKHKTSVTDVLQFCNLMETECLRNKLPEYTAAGNFIKEELK